MNGGAYALRATVDGALLAYADTGGMASTDTWCYKVKGVTGVVEGAFSNEGCAVKDMIYPGAGAVSHPTWMLAFGDLVSDDSTLVTSLDLSGLKLVTGNLYLDSSTLLTSVNLNALQRVDLSLHLSNSNVIPSFSLPALTSIGVNLLCDFCPLLTTVSIPQLAMGNGKSYLFDSSGLNVASVNAVLARGVASGVTSATIRLDGGTNAAPAGQGATDKAALIAAGNTLTTN